jgi:molybdopterin molybdotransferase
MPEFLQLSPPGEALARFLAAIPAKDIRTEILPSQEALGRVLAQDVRAPHSLPPFARSTVDGYAVRARDTFGASPSLPAYLRLVGEVRMGVEADCEVGVMQAAKVHTGGMIPADADAVVMLEDTQQAHEDELEILKAVASGNNVLVAGEDVEQGDLVLETGIQLRAQEIGGLMALGITKIAVACKPTVGILSTGDEVIAPDQEQGPGQVRDVNSYTLSALVERSGGHARRFGIIPDRFEALLTAARLALQECDLVVITAGSSVSTRDMTADVIAELGAPGVLVHGISIKPGKPTILAVADGRPFIGLPGNPVSALVVAGLFVTPVVRRLLGLQGPAWIPERSARMAVNIASESGREDYLPVALEVTPEGLLAQPIYGRSNLIFTLVRADGLVRIAPEATGLAAGEPVRVQMF